MPPANLGLQRRRKDRSARDRLNKVRDRSARDRLNKDRGDGLRDLAMQMAKPEIHLCAAAGRRRDPPSCEPEEDARTEIGGGGDNEGFQRQQQIRQEIDRHRTSLPIFSVRARLIEEVRKNDTLIIIGETGSGKTTQLPQYLLSAGFCEDGKVIGVTQPRRVAAVTVGKRVAEECNVKVGDTVGYAVRFEDVTSKFTKIKYMTDGLLVREILADPMLSKYSVIIIDEAHERTIHTDVLLGLLKGIQDARRSCLTNKQLDYGNAISSVDERDKKLMLLNGHRIQKLSPLKLIIMSASLDAKCFNDFFGGAKALHIEGRQHPVEVFYTFQPQQNYEDATFIVIFQIHLIEGDGDILAFLTGQDEIKSVELRIHNYIKQIPEHLGKIITVPMYSSLPSKQQMKVFKPSPPGFRKVILATNIAETSVTIPGIRFVIDPGFVKVRSYNPCNGMESLVIVPTSKAQAIQRSGRAGRERPGKCFRLYPENEFGKLLDSSIPEIQRCDITNIVLQLIVLGIDDIAGFDFMNKPSRMAIVKALEQLLLLGALNEKCKLLYPIGHQMARLPLDPIYSKAILLSSEFKCLEEMLIVVAMLSVECIFYFSHDKEEVHAQIKRFSGPEGDHITLLKAYRASLECLEKSELVSKTEREAQKRLRKWCKANCINSRSLRHAWDVHRQIKGYVQQMGLPNSSCGDDMHQFRRCLTASFFLKAAEKQHDASYKTFYTGQVVKIHPFSILSGTKPECIIFDELVHTNHNYIRNVTRIDPLWLKELAPQLYDPLWFK